VLRTRTSATKPTGERWKRRTLALFINLVVPLTLAHRPEIAKMKRFSSTQTQKGTRMLVVGAYEVPSLCTCRTQPLKTSTAPSQTLWLK
jgi:hypothetical protein